MAGCNTRWMVGEIGVEDHRIRWVEGGAILDTNDKGQDGYASLYFAKGVDRGESDGKWRK